MRTEAVEEVLRPRSDGWLTTGEAAARLGTSRQHVVDLCKQGELPFATTGHHRRVRLEDVEALQAGTRRMTRDQRRSLWLGHAIAGKLVTDPQRTLSVARENLARLQEANPRGGTARRLAEWQRLLDGSAREILDALTSSSPRARELRQNTPFAGVLSDEERQQVLAGFDVAEGKAPHG